MRNFTKSLICVFILFPLVGCWDRIEINDIVIATASSVDKVDEHTIRYGFQAPLPGEMGGAGSTGGGGGTSGGASIVYVDSEVGKSVGEAKQKLQDRLSRRLTLGHRRVSIFGEDLAKDGLGQVLDNLTRTRDGRLPVGIFIAEGQAIDIFSAKPQFENYSSEAVRELGFYRYDQTIKDFLLNLQQNGKDPILPVVRLVKNESEDDNLVEDQVDVSRLAIFKRDKLAFITNEKETYGAEWMKDNGMKGRAYTFEYEKNDHVSILTTEHSMKMSHTIENEQPVFSIEIDVKGNLLEDETTLNLEEVNVLEKLSKKMAEEIKSQINTMIDRTSSEGIDTFGFGRYLHRKEAKKWKEWKDTWREQLPSVNYNVTVNSEIEVLGLITEGIEREEW